MGKVHNNKGVNAINSRSKEESKEHRSQALQAVHECKMRGFTRDEIIEALQKRFSVGRDMARIYIQWYKQEKTQKHKTDLTQKHNLIWDRFEHLYGKAMEAAEASGDYKQPMEVNDRMARLLEAEEKRMARTAAPVEAQVTKVSWAERTPAERRLARELYELEQARLNGTPVIIELQLPEAQAAAAAEATPVLD